MTTIENTCNERDGSFPRLSVWSLDIGRRLTLSLSLNQDPKRAAQMFRMRERLELSRVSRSPWPETAAFGPGAPRDVRQKARLGL